MPYVQKKENRKKENREVLGNLKTDLDKNLLLWNFFTC